MVRSRPPNPAGRRHTTKRCKPRDVLQDESLRVEEHVLLDHHLRFLEEPITSRVMIAIHLESPRQLHQRLATTVCTPGYIDVVLEETTTELCFLQYKPNDTSI